nr:hypothetical protein [Solanum melongena]WMB97052.1 hypothetical protein [Solanum aethiopicum]WMB97128.1 hypothetical protein [Solanum aethiopicum]
MRQIFTDHKSLRYLMTQKELNLRQDGTLLFRGRVCVPQDSDLCHDILEEAHSSPFFLHPGSTKMYRTIRPHYWWKGMKRDVAEYVAKCLVCQLVKAEHQRPAGPLQPVQIPQWKWDEIAMDFVSGLPKTARQDDAIWVIIDRLTKSAHFLPISMTYSTGKLAQIYIDEIVRLHGIPSSIVSDRDPRFTSALWQSLLTYDTGQLRFFSRLSFADGRRARA